MCLCQPGYTGADCQTGPWHGEEMGTPHALANCFPTMLQPQLEFWKGSAQDGRQWVNRLYLRLTTPLDLPLQS